MKRACILASLFAFGLLAAVPTAPGSAPPSKGSADSPEVQVSEGYVTVEDGLRLYYRTVGNGPETVVIPGALYLASEFEPLARGRRLVFYDMRNRGRSDAVADPSQLGMQFELRDLEAIRQHLHVERMALIGWSYLGGVVTLYAHDHPERVTRLIQIGPIPPRRNPYMDQVLPLDARVDPAGIKRIEEMRQAGLPDSDPVAFCRSYWKVYPARYVGDPSAIARIHMPCELPNEWVDNFYKHFDHLLRAFGEWDWRSAAASVKVPTLVMHGREDFLPLEGAREWAAAFPNARLLVILGVGHFPWAERPETFFSAAERFLAGEWPEGAEIVRAVDESAETPKKNTEY